MMITKREIDSFFYQLEGEEPQIITDSMEMSMIESLEDKERALVFGQDIESDMTIGGIDFSNGQDTTTSNLFFVDKNGRLITPEEVFNTKRF